MSKLFTKNTSTKCGCSDPKKEEEIFCFYCAAYWGNALKDHHLPFANENDKVDHMNEVFEEWSKLLQEQREAQRASGAIG